MRARARKRFFFAKKNQKTFDHKPLRRRSRKPQSKSFCFFLQKAALSSLAPVCSLNRPR
jgi:hypothetical protein